MSNRESIVHDDEIYLPLCFLISDITTEPRARQDDLTVIQESPIVLSPVLRDLIQMRVLREDSAECLATLGLASPDESRRRP